jgi:hypothetical protein
LDSEFDFGHGKACQLVRNMFDSLEMQDYFGLTCLDDQLNSGLELDTKGNNHNLKVDQLAALEANPQIKSSNLTQVVNCRIEQQRLLS